MRLLNRNSDLSHFLGCYGQDPRWGVLSEHVEMFREAGGYVHPGQATQGWAVIDGVGYPIVCSELIWVYDEDGRRDGRCGLTHCSH